MGDHYTTISAFTRATDYLPADRNLLWQISTAGIMRHRNCQAVVFDMYEMLGNREVPI